MELIEKTEAKPFGFVIIDKPSGISSHDCVQRLRKHFRIKRVGHAGTLDPAVTGVLPIAIGDATRLIKYLPQGKVYKGRIKLGMSTTTDDLEGEILNENSWPKLDIFSLEQYLNKFRGVIEQKPPKVSSVHIKGERAYKRARKGEKFILPSRQITINELNLLKWEVEKGEIEIQIDCSSGTYIRSIARDLGEEIGCGGCLASLRRIESSGFKEKQAIKFEDIKSKEESKQNFLIDPLISLGHLPIYQIKKRSELDFWRTGRGFEISQESIIKAAALGKNQLESIIIIDSNQQICGIASYNESKIKPKVVFNAIG